jgi:O-antigen/teichoic acid export membrane protein
MRAFLKDTLQHRGYMRGLSSGYLLIAVSILTQGAFVPLYLNAFGQYQFGVLMVLLSLVNFMGVGIAWLSPGASRLLGEHAALGDESEFRRAFGLIKTIYLGYGVILSILIGVMGVGFDKVLFSGGTEADIRASRPALLLMGVYLVFLFPASMDRLALTARKREGAANMAQLAGIVTCAVGIVPWLLSDGDMFGVMICQILGALVSIFVTRRVLNRELPGLRMRMPTRQNTDLLKRLGGPTGAGFFLHGALVLALVADTMLVSWLGGARAAAEFYLVWKMGEVLVILLEKISGSMGPYFVQMDVRSEHVELKRIARLGYAAVGAASLCIGIIYALLGPYLVALWVGEAHAPSDPLSYALAGGAIFWLGISRLPVVLARSRVALRQLNWAGGIELLGKLAITVLLFPHFGYVAVLLGINLLHGLGVSTLYFRLLRRTP